MWAPLGTTSRDYCVGKSQGSSKEGSYCDPSMAELAIGKKVCISMENSEGSAERASTFRLKESFFLLLRDDPSRGRSQTDLRMAARLVFHEAA